MNRAKQCVRPVTVTCNNLEVSFVGGTVSLIDGTVSYENCNGTNPSSDDIECNASKCGKFNWEK